MGHTTTDERTDYENEVLTALADQRRRRALQILDNIDRAQPETLATHLAAETGKPLMEVTPAEAERIQGTLKHVHLPRLEDAGLIHWNDGTVTKTDHPAFQDPKIDRIIDTDASEWDAILESLADERRRVVLTVLSQHGEPMDRTDLAGELKTRLQTDWPEDDDGLVGLHHVHLPKLDEAGLVDYDVDAEMVSYEGHPDLDEEWLVSGPTDTPRAILTMARQSADIWTLEGRKNVTERGRALCESADDELFMMFTIDDAVETACLRRLQDAVDRGVDVYLGTQNKQLRDVVRETVPEVTIWEPQLDWLNLPPTREKVGRLIIADREEIMIGTVGRDAPGGAPCETAITGAGEDNPLVALLREMLGSRIDHLDAQSEDFRSQIPL